MPEVVVVAQPRQGRYVQRIEAGAHRLLSDEPAPTGDDRGPDPYSLLLSALGACTSMTLRMYADREGWALGNVTVHLTYERVHPDDCEGCEDPEAWVHRIERVLTVDGELTDEQRDKLAQIAERCPVHRTLMEETEIITRLADHS